jgi:DUF4097 and DUF4098 domain-containing protein YvlB
LILGSLTVIFFALTTVGQTPMPDSDKLNVIIKELHDELDDRSQDLAEEYLDILEQLQEIVEDYSDYLSDLDPEARKAHPISFKVFTDAFKNSRYAKSHEPLHDDLEAFIRELHSLEKEHGGGPGMATPQCCRTVRNLRREMSILVDLVGDYSDNISERRNWDDDVETYLKAAMQGLAMALRVNKEEIIKQLYGRHSHEEVQEALRSLEAIESLEGIAALEALEALEALKEIEIAVPPVAPEPPEAIRPGKRYPDRHGGRTTVQTYTASMGIENRRETIIVINRLGDIRINGWKKDLMVATFEIEIEAESQIRKEQLIAQTMLEAGESEGKYRVEAYLPKIKDPNIRIINSVLTVNLPSSNPIECESSFGGVEVTDLDSGFRINGQNSEIRIQQVNGSVTARNSMGLIELGEINGRIDVRNGYSPIEVSDCAGDMDLENAYALVSVVDCRGDIKIDNSGTVEVFSHVGNIIIENTYGRVEVKRLNGDLRAVNAYQPIVVRQISGSARLENKYGEISADGVDGSFSASNTNGLIQGQNLNGPLDIKAENGNVMLILNHELNGNSTVSASFGTVDLAMAEASNIMLVAKTVNGKIQSLLPLEIKGDSMIKSAEYRFGRGRDSLAVTGNNIAIIISDSQ